MSPENWVQWHIQAYEKALECTITVAIYNVSAQSRWQTCECVGSRLCFWDSGSFSMYGQLQDKKWKRLCQKTAFVTLPSRIDARRQYSPLVTRETIENAINQPNLGLASSPDSSSVGMGYPFRKPHPLGARYSCLWRSTLAGQISQIEPWCNNS